MASRRASFPFSSAPWPVAPIAAAAMHRLMRAGHSLNPNTARTPEEGSRKKMSKAAKREATVSRVLTSSFLLQAAFPPEVQPVQEIMHILQARYLGFRV